jgi:magnesium-transporting ATPase (P-type)
MILSCITDPGHIFAFPWYRVAFSTSLPAAILPTSFILPKSFSLERLSQFRILCSSSDSILMAGQVNVAFFDKTGTLTYQGLDYTSCRSADSWTSGQWTSDTMAMAMSVCHSLTMSKTGTLIGNPLDCVMFQATRAQLVEALGATVTVKSSTGEKYSVLRRFDFDHNRMTQSVIVRLPNGVIRILVKGSGENISKLCLPATLPEDFSIRLKFYSRQGIYQLAVGTKDLSEDTKIEDVSEMTRDQVEGGLTFAGVLNFANKMREDTPEVVKQLAAANVQSIMLTGDNLYTGIHIARKSGIIASQKEVLLGILDKDGKINWKDENDVKQEQPVVHKSDSELTVELAMSGEAWQVLLATNKESAITLAPFVRVFGRCSPLDKVSVVDTFTSLGFTTLMCGDGGNDCGALKAAHVGLALSDSDASIGMFFFGFEAKDNSTCFLVRPNLTRCLFVFPAVFTLRLLLSLQYVTRPNFGPICHL